MPEYDINAELVEVVQGQQLHIERLEARVTMLEDAIRSKPNRHYAWRDLADKIAGQIRSGEYAPGQKLPHIAEMVAAGAGSTNTVHAAYLDLQARGLVRITRGQGTFVRNIVWGNGAHVSARGENFSG